MLKEIVINLLCGLAVGGVFAFLRLPAPAPISIPPVFGILGITLGFLLIDFLLKIQR